MGQLSSSGALAKGARRAHEAVFSGALFSGCQMAALRGATAALIALLVSTGGSVQPWGLSRVIEGELGVRALGASWAWLLYHAAALVWPLLAIPTLVELVFTFSERLTPRRRVLTWALGAVGMAGIGGYEAWRALAAYEPFARSATVGMVYAVASVLLAGLSFGLLSRRGNAKLRTAVALSLILAAVLAVWGANRALADQYPTAHLSVFVFELLALQLALVELLRPIRAQRTWRVLSSVPVLVLLVVMATGWTTTLSRSELGLLRQHAPPARGLFMQLEVTPYQFPCPGDATSSALAGASPEREFRSHVALPEWPTLRDPNPNLLLVSVESLRPDALSFNRAGGKRPGTLSDWRDRAMWFPRAYAPAPRTLHSIGAVMTLSPTSRAPLALSTHRSWRGELLPEADTLAETFMAQGSLTFAHHHTLGIGEHITGLTQGFARAKGYAATTDKDALSVDQRIVAGALEELQTTPPDKGFFGWLFLASPHLPWFAPGEPPRRQRSREAFVNEVERAERALSTLLEGLSSSGRLENTIVVIFGDHGEGLGERQGPIGHGFTPYEEQIRTATLVFHPGFDGGSFQEPISLLHILSSLLLSRTDGVLGFVRQRLAADQLPMLRATDYSIVVERLAPEEPKVALIRGNQKWIHGYATDLTEAYDLEADPGELSDRWRAPPAQQAAARTLLDGYRAWHGCQHRYRYTP